MAEKRKIPLAKCIGATAEDGSWRRCQMELRKNPFVFVLSNSLYSVGICFFSLGPSELLYLSNKIKK